MNRSLCGEGKVKIKLTLLCSFRAFISATDWALCRETSPRCTLHSPRFPPPPRKHNRGSPKTSSEEKKPLMHETKSFSQLNAFHLIQLQTSEIQHLFFTSLMLNWSIISPPLVPAGLILSKRPLSVLTFIPGAEAELDKQEHQRPHVHIETRDGTLFSMWRLSLQENFQRIPAFQRPASCSRNKGGFS